MLLRVRQQVQWGRNQVLWMWAEAAWRGALTSDHHELREVVCCAWSHCEEFWGARTRLGFAVDRGITVRGEESRRKLIWLVSAASRDSQLEVTSLRR